MELKPSVSPNAVRKLNMKEFGEILKNVIMQKSSVKDVAQYCNISERTLYRYIKGERKPDSIEVVEKMARFLTMDPRTKTQFIEAFKAMVVGVDVYRKRQMIDAFMKSLIAMKITDKLNERPRIFAKNSLMEGTMPIYDDRTLQMVIQHILSQRAEETDNNTLYIASGPSNMDIFESLRNTSVHSANIEHIIALSVNDSESTAIDSIQYLSHLIPLVVGNSGYRVYSYFMEANAGGELYMSYPEIIIAGQEVLAYSCKSKNGILFNDSKMADFFLANFNELKKGSDPFVHALSSDTLSEDYLGNFMHMFSDKEYRGIVSVSPCTAVIANDEIIGRCVKKDGITHDALENYNIYRTEGTKLMTSNSLTGDVLSMQGVNAFLATGKLSDTPDNMYNPPSEADRYTCIENLYNLAKTKEPYSYRFRFLKDTWQIGDYGVEIGISSTLITIAFKRENGQIGFFTINDPGTILAFCDYIDSQLDEIAFSEEESLSKLHDILEKHRKK